MQFVKMQQNCIRLTSFCRRIMASSLDSLVGQNIMVVTTDGRCFHGTLKGFDQTINLILDAAHERVYSPDEGIYKTTFFTCSTGY